MEKEAAGLKILITIPHIFSPKEGSVYSSENEEKREIKKEALVRASLGNKARHMQSHWIHASLGHMKKIVTRRLQSKQKIEITIQVYTKTEQNLIENLDFGNKIEIFNCGEVKNESVPLLASKRALEQSQRYDITGYIEDDIFIEDNEFFLKLQYLQSVLPAEYALMPHRCEIIEDKAYVILSGDPDEERKDLFWATGERIAINWPTGAKEFYRATNPHSGCFFLSRKQAGLVYKYWQERGWRSNFQLSGPLEQAASGILLPVLKIMKPIPEDFKFLMVNHQDELWKRHEYE